MFFLMAMLIGVIVVMTAVISNIATEEKNQRYAFDVIKTQILEVKPIIERQAENTGCSVGYGKHLSYHEHYRYRDVVVGEKVVFLVFWDKGGTSEVECKKDDDVYKKLIRKVQK